MATKKPRVQIGQTQPEPKVGDMVKLRFDLNNTSSLGVIVGTNSRYKKSVNVLRNGAIETYLASFLVKA